MSGGMPYVVVPVRERVGPVELELLALDDFERTVARVYAARKGAGGIREQADLCPMFGVVWSAARALAARVAAEGEAMRGRRVLELGCGLALPSLVASRLGAEVVASDQHPDTEAFLMRNLAHNGLTGVRYRRFDWREAAPEDVPEGGFDHVLASDVLFEATLPDLVARTFARFLRPGGTGWVADPGRAWLPELLDAADRHGLDAEVDVEVVVRPGGVEESFLITLRAAGPA